MYAKDASVKMTSAMKIKMESGEYWWRMPLWHEES